MYFNGGNMNYQIILDETIKNLETTPTLLLHACCAPCSSYVLEYLSDYFKISVLFYNPNISPESEYLKRLNELKEFVKNQEYKNPVDVIEGVYEPKKFYDFATPLKDLKEGSHRCFLCYEFRMKQTAIMANDKFDYFTTTLSISPYKNSKWINEIGSDLEKKYNTKYLFADFKKKNGYLRSIELARENKLYRQDYCGCIYSKLERENKNRN
jgi:predicted adenine nucleotide alpha hydrolase (AANH) superfamily ATPase